MGPMAGTLSLHGRFAPYRKVGAFGMSASERSTLCVSYLRTIGESRRDTHTHTLTKGRTQCTRSAKNAAQIARQHVLNELEMARMYRVESEA